MTNTFKIKYIDNKGHVCFVNIDAADPLAAVKTLKARMRENGGGAIKVITTKNITGKRKAKIYG